MGGVRGVCVYVIRCGAPLGAGGAETLKMYCNGFKSFIRRVRDAAPLSEATADLS